MKNKYAKAACLLAGTLFLFGAAYMETGKNVFAGHDFILQAHRGLSQRCPENTAISFQAAAKRKEFQGIETDIQETADGVLVLYHDSDISKKTDASGRICDYTYKELQEIHIINANNSEKYPEEKIPTLEEFLDICRESGKIPYLELKSLTKEGMYRLIEILDEGNWQNRCVITSFDQTLIKMFRSLNDSYPIEYMIDKNTAYRIEDVAAYLSLQENMVFRPNAYVVTEEDVKYCKKLQIPVECFGLKTGDKKRLLELKKMGVTGVTCNDYKGL